MKHVYPPRHPAWLDDKPAPPPQAGADSPRAVAPRGQGDAARDDSAGAGQGDQGGRKDAVDGAAGASGRPDRRGG